MEVSDTIIYVMKIMWWGLKRILSSRFRDIQKSVKKSKFRAKFHLDKWLENSLVFRVTRKKIHQNFLHRNMTLNRLLTLLKINVSYLELCLLNITAIENIRFEIYLRFIWIQTYRIFYFSTMLYAKHHTLSSWCRIFNSRSRSRKIRILSISKLFFFLFLSWWYRFY